MLGETALWKEDRGTSKSNPAHVLTGTNTVGILSYLKDTDRLSAMRHNNSLITGTIINLNNSKRLIVWVKWHWGLLLLFFFIEPIVETIYGYGIYGKSRFTFNPQQNLNVSYSESLLFTDNWGYLVHYSFKSSFPGHNKGYLGGQDGELVIWWCKKTLKCQVFKKGQTTLSHKTPFTAQKANKNTVHVPTLHNITPAVLTSMSIVSYSLAEAALRCSSWNKPRTQSFWGWRRSRSSFLSLLRRLHCPSSCSAATRPTNTSEELRDVNRWEPLAREPSSQHWAAHSCSQKKDGGKKRN